jgi:membrane-associated HD superfamily phosphohydrolase
VFWKLDKPSFIVLSLNLILGLVSPSMNILGLQAHVIFSFVAMAVLTFFLKRIQDHTRLITRVIYASVATVLVPLLSMKIIFTDFSDPSSILKALIFGAISTWASMDFTAPMLVLNIFLFSWLFRQGAKGTDTLVSP